MANIVNSQVIEGIAGLIESYGQNAEELAALVGLDPRALYRPDILISELTVNDVYEEAARLCQDRFFALKVAQLQNLDMLGPIWRVMRSARTVGESMELFAQNLELHAQAMSAYIEHQDSGVSVVFEVRRLKTPPRQRRPVSNSTVQVTEHALALMSYEMRRLLGNSSWRPRFVRFRCAPPTNPAPLRQVFGENLFFNQDVNAIHMETADWQHPLKDSDYSNRRFNERELESSLGRGLPFVLRIDKIIRLLINSEGCSAPQVAATIELPLRTLQYQLKQHDTSYQRLYDTARLDLARHYLKKSNLSIGAVSERLRFADSAAFTRFFKTGAGCTPRAYRKRAMFAGSPQ